MWSSESKPTRPSALPRLPDCRREVKVRHTEKEECQLLLLMLVAVAVSVTE